MANTETVTLRLPSGEEIDAVVPAGMSDAQIKAYTVSKRPDLFAKAGVPLPGLARPANAPLPRLSTSEQMPVSQAETDSQQTGVGVGGTLAQLGGPAAAGLAIARGGAALPVIAARTLPPVTEIVKSFGVWAKANPELAGMLHTVLKATAYGAAGMKFIKSLPTQEK
jgi:hypothetical protein